MSSVLIVGYDPHTVPGVDADALLKGLDLEMARFEKLGIDTATALITPDESSEPPLVAQLTDRPWDVVLIGGGVRRQENLIQFERVLNLTHRHAPQAAVAFNSSMGDCVEAAQRWL
ncbi:hypothetical protein [Streptomyces corynorhini]|uniref:Uncharacterized protein n=1 Tax=Streptomyces corynorhini TaxID=2282652 RepID=A0A370BCS8_9ACTN|nr:hypothetical protein [Streptomyces corynorhini]RDG37593.1 hypothetical protein DVH02_13850 [Streptomyces corynorhini]